MLSQLLVDRRALHGTTGFVVRSLECDNYGTLLQVDEKYRIEMHRNVDGRQTRHGVRAITAGIFVVCA